MTVVRGNLIGRQFHPEKGGDKIMDNNFKTTITLFHCINAFSEAASLALSTVDHSEVRIVKLPCSAMVRDVFLLRAFEAGSDAVVVLACPEGQCRHVDGNMRAKKRVERVKNLLDEIGLDGRRLALFNVSPEDEAAAVQIIRKTLLDLDDLGPNPAAQICSAAIR